MSWCCRDPRVLPSPDPHPQGTPRRQRVMDAGGGKASARPASASPQQHNKHIQDAGCKDFPGRQGQSGGCLQPGERAAKRPAASAATGTDGMHVRSPPSDAAAAGAPPSPSERSHHLCWVPHCPPPPPPLPATPSMYPWTPPRRESPRPRMRQRQRGERSAVEWHGGCPVPPVGRPRHSDCGSHHDRGGPMVSSGAGWEGGFNRGHYRRGLRSACAVSPKAVTSAYCHKRRHRSRQLHLHLRRHRHRSVPPGRLPRRSVTRPRTPPLWSPACMEASSSSTTSFAQLPVANGKFREMARRSKWFSRSE